MSITGLFVLPEDVLVFPVAELPQQLRAQVSGDPGDFVITRPNARHPSKIVDPDAAALLERFRAATTIVDAVIGFSASRKLDPHQVLQDAFRFVATVTGR